MTRKLSEYDIMITIVMVKKILTDPAVCLENFQSKYNNDFKLTVGLDPTKIFDC